MRSRASVLLFLAWPGLVVGCKQESIPFEFVPPNARGAEQTTERATMDTPELSFDGAVERVDVPKAAPPPPRSWLTAAEWTEELIVAALSEFPPHEVDGQFELESPDQGITATLTKDGVTLSDAARWSAAVELVQIGRNEAPITFGRAEPMLTSCLEIASEQPCPRGVVYRRDGLAELWVNAHQGLVQRLVITERPPGNGPLLVDVRFEGDVTGRLTGDKSAVTFSAEDGSRAFTVGDPRVRDAIGWRLTNQLSWWASGRMRLVVDDEAATYPLTVTLVAAQCAWTWCADGDPATLDVCLDFGTTCERSLSPAFVGLPCAGGPFCCSDGTYEVDCAGHHGGWDGEPGSAECEPSWCADGDPGTLDVCGPPGDGNDFTCLHPFDPSMEGLPCVFGIYCCEDGLYHADCGNSIGTDCPDDWCDDGDATTLDMCASWEDESTFDCTHGLDPSMEGQPCLFGDYCCADGVASATCGVGGDLGGGGSEEGDDGEDDGPVDPGTWTGDPGWLVPVCPPQGDPGFFDADSDGVCDELDRCDGSDPAVQDLDGSGGIGEDAHDDDGDHVPNDCEVCPGLDDALFDSNDDGVCDVPPDPCWPDVDADNDGQCDAVDPCPSDSPDDVDGDGVCGDGIGADADICPGFDDALAADADGDGVCDDLDVCPGFDDTIDSDGDGFPNGQAAKSVAQAVANQCDLCPFDPDKTVFGALGTGANECGCGLPETTTCTAAGAKLPFCGDGVFDPGEICDDGNAADGDGCTASCDGLEAGWVCFVPGSPCLDIDECAWVPSPCPPESTCTNSPGSFSCSCPAGTWPSATECAACDVACDGCTGAGASACEACADGFVDVEGECTAACGNGEVDAGEECDDGNDVSDDGCSSECLGAPVSLATFSGDGLLGAAPAALGEILMFVADDSIVGPEPWKTDGTPGGTAMVADVRPGPKGSAPAELVALGGAVLMSADDGESALLWRSDGYASGTGLAAEIEVDSEHAGRRVALSDRLIVAADGGELGQELWAYQPATGQTWLLADVQPGPVGSSPRRLTAFEADGERVAFVADDGSEGAELWTYAPASEAVSPVGPIVAGAQGADPAWLTPLGSVLLFAAEEPEKGRALWAWDPLSGAVSLVRDVFDGPSSADPTHLVAGDGAVYFAADDGVHGRELWRTDGTFEGTHLVKDIRPGALSSSPTDLSRFGNRVLFTADDGPHGREVWSTLGDAEGTRLLLDADPGGAGATTGSWFSILGDRLFFPAGEDGDFGLWMVR